MSEGNQKILYHAFKKSKERPHLSGYCGKLEIYLRVAGIPYEYKSAWPADAPRHKLPFVTLPSKDGTNPTTISDSALIIDHFEKEGNYLTAAETTSSAEETAVLARAWCSYIQEYALSALAGYRWCADEAYNRMFTEVFGAAVPWPLSVVIGWNTRRRVVKQQYAAGWGRFSPEELVAMLVKVLDDIEQLLRVRGKRQQNRDNGTLPTLFGTQDDEQSKPGIADVVTFAYLANLFSSEAHKPITEHLLQKCPVASEYTLQYTKAYFPEWVHMIADLENVSKHK